MLKLVMIINWDFEAKQQDFRNHIHLIRKTKIKTKEYLKISQ